MCRRERGKREGEGGRRERREGKGEREGRREGKEGGEGGRGGREGKEGGGRMELPTKTAWPLRTTHGVGCQ